MNKRSGVSANSDRDEALSPSHVGEKGKVNVWEAGVEAGAAVAVAVAKPKHQTDMQIQLEALLLHFLT